MQKFIEILGEVKFAYPEESKCIYCIPKGLTISEGKMYSISGISGSGKSTVLTLLAGLRRFKTGSIVYRLSLGETKTMEVNAKNWSENVGPHFWGKIGFSFQKPELLRALSVGMNLKLALGEKYEEMALTLFESNEWRKIKHSRTWEISGGQIQRLGLIRAFGQTQNLVFMDEPTNNLDKSNRERVVSFIQQYGKGKAIVLVSHDTLFLDMLNIEATFEIGEEGESRGSVKRVLRQVVLPTIDEVSRNETNGNVAPPAADNTCCVKTSGDSAQQPDNNSSLSGKVNSSSDVESKRTESSSRVIGATGEHRKAVKNQKKQKPSHK